MKKIKILEKEFKMAIPSANIRRAIEQMAYQINNDYLDEDVVFISILNGAFMFSSDLLKRIKINCQVSFVKLSSYDGTSSTGNIKEIIGLDGDITGKNVIIIEDIVDTGNTIVTIHKQLKEKKPKSLKVATLLFKPQAYVKNLKIDYVGLEIPDGFIVGYGLDYNGYGRNTEDIYTLINS